MRLAGIAPEAYRHPMDQQATAALRTVPGFALAVSKVSRYGLEQLVYMDACANAVKVTARQCGDIHALLVEACRVLDLPEPALFLSQTPIPNALAVGHENPTIVLHTGVVELLEEDELLAVIAHELGHIHCGHSVYRLMALLVALLAKYGSGPLGVGDIFSVSLQAALLEWSRKAEFSADRAALLVVQNPETIFSALFKLTGGSPKVFAQMDREEYLKQADEYDRPDAGRLDKFFRLMLEGGKTHPIPVLRAREALRYGESDAYKAILSGEYPRREKGVSPLRAIKGAAGDTILTCPHCGEATDGAFSFCTICGRGLEDGGEAAREEATGEKETPD